MTRPRLLLLSAFVLVAAASRVLPHPPNFSPVAAVALFGAATFPGRWSAVLVAFGSMFLGDILLQLTFAAGWQPSPGFYSGQWVVYACLIAAILMGLAMGPRPGLARVAAATLANAVVFYLVTNCIWLYGEGSLYPRTLAGQIQSYEMALPFFRNSLAGDSCFVAALFGGLAMAEARFPSLRSPALA